MRWRTLAICAALGAMLVALGSCSTTTDVGGGGVYKVGKPYKVNGVWYYPHEDPHYDETGIASWYGEDFHGLKTANGEDYDMDAMTAAHKTLPMPVMARVVNLENGKSVVVRINDRGPFVDGRIIDLSRAAAKELGIIRAGTARVRVTYLGRADGTQFAVAETPKGEEMAPPAPTEDVIAAAIAAPPATGETPAPPVTAMPVPVAAAAVPSSGNGRVASVPVPARERFYVQAGAFASAANANALAEELSRLGVTSVSPANVNGKSLYRVRVGPLASATAADAMLERVQALGISGAKIIVD